MPPRRLLALLIVLSTAGLVTGVAIERSTEGNHEVSAAAGASADGSGSAEGTEGSEGAEASHEAEATGTAEHGESAGAAEHSESDTLLGIDLESLPLVALAAAVMLGLAVGVWFRPGWALLLALVLVAMLAFAVLDVREVFHQLDEHRAGLAALAGIVAILHLAAGGLSRARPPAPDCGGNATSGRMARMVRSAR